MRVLLLHNPKAGREDHSREGLMRLFACHGHTIIYRDIKSDEIEPADAAGVDCVAIAGGDGTVGKVLRALIDVDRPFTILPLGTANNMARSLKLPLGAGDTVCCVDEATEKRFDVGIARGPWGERLFFEAVGIGALAEMIQTGNSAKLSPEDKQHFGDHAPHRFVQDAPAQDWQVRVDGEELPGEMIFFEALNMPITGPNLPLGPSGCFDNGLLSLAVLRPDGRDSFLSWLAGSRDRSSTGLERLTAKRVDLVWPRGALRIDDDLPKTPEEPRRVAIELAPQKLRLRVPKTNGDV